VRQRANLRQQSEIYGTQCSFSITGPSLDGCNGIDLHHRQKFYDDFMSSCHRQFSKRDCDEEEKDRHKMNRNQPQSMVNMTSTGYRKIKAPPALIKLLSDFWETNKQHKVEEEWGFGNIFTNHWEAPTYMVSVEDENLEGAGAELKKAVWDAAIDGIAEWTGGVAKLRPVSLYGIREYTEGAILSPHVDRVPLVSSGIVNVAQDVDEPWPLEVYDRQGHAVNITMEPGEMILYESHSLIHGRPFPLKGRFYANIFIHFEPYEGWETARDNTKLGDNDGDLPPYILPGSTEEKRYREENPNGWSKFFAEGEEPPVNDWASEGRLNKLMQIAKIDQRMLWFQDHNGWAPLHEAARGGHLTVVKYLIESGADINDVTEEDASPLRIAINSLGEDHPVVKYLQELGAEDKGEVVDEYYVRDDDGEDSRLDEEGNYVRIEDYVPSESVQDEIVPSIVQVIEQEVMGIIPTLAADDDEEL